MNLIKTMGDIFILNPQLAAIPAIAFAVLWYFVRNKFVLAAAIAWGLYGIDEYLNKIRVFCSGECNIRIDLFLIYPILIILSGIAIFFGIRTSVGRGKSGSFF